MLVAGFAVLAAVLATTLRVTVVQGESMLPTYSDGQLVLVNRLAYAAGAPRRGDVILLRRGNEVLIKRVGYLAGDHIDGTIARGFAPVTDFFDKPAKGPADSLMVPRGVLVVLGDNPANSEDSRAFGPIPLADVLGRVIGAPPKP